MTLLDTLDELHRLPHATPAVDIAQLAHGLIGSARTVFFAADANGRIATNGIDNHGAPIPRPSPSASDLHPFYHGFDAEDGLPPLYDLEPGEWISLRLDAGIARGALVADGLRITPTKDDIRSWRAFAATLALRIALTKDLDDVVRRAQIDELTRVYVRAVAFESVERRLANGLETTLIVVDLDNFKTINDTLGHDAGDQILIRAAKALQTSTRTSDIVARFGGDEFVVVSDLEPPLLVDRLEKAMAAAGVDASIGGARSSETARTREELFVAADFAMLSKKATRPHRRKSAAPAT